MESTTAYYVADVPDVASTTRYQHALAVGEYAKQSLLLTHSQPLSEIADTYDEIQILSSNPASRVWQAIRIINRKACGPSNMNFITTGQYEPTLVGYLSNQRWICDIYDDPVQGVLNQPRSYHQLLSRIRRRIISRSDRRVYTLHPRHPRIDDRDSAARYTLNGAPTEVINSTIVDFDPPIQFVQAGKTRLESGLQSVLRALSQVSVPFKFDIYGQERSSVQKCIKKQGLSSQVTMHGRTPHKETRQAIEEAHMGFCVLANRSDWRCQYPIKVGEYLAAGTIPILSNFPGMRELAKTTGLYIEPDANLLASLLNQELSMPKEKYRQRAKNARKQAERISWKDEREWFFEQAVR